MTHDQDRIRNNITIAEHYLGATKVGPCWHYHDHESGELLSVNRSEIAWLGEMLDRVQPDAYSRWRSETPSRIVRLGR